MFSNEQAFRLLCKLADELQAAEDSGDDKMMGRVPDDMLLEVLQWSGQLHVPPAEEE